MKKITTAILTVLAIFGLFFFTGAASQAATSDNAKPNSQASTKATVAFSVPVGYTIDPDDPSKLVSLDDVDNGDNNGGKVNTIDNGTTKVTKTSTNEAPKKTSTPKSTNIPNSTGNTKATKTGYSKLPQTGSSEISPAVLVTLVGASLIIVFTVVGRELVVKKHNVVK